MNRQRATGSFIFLAASLAGACGGGGGSTDKYSTADKFCEAKGEEECQVAPRCGVTEASCLAARKAECLRVVAASTTAVRQYRPGHAQACIDKTRSVYQANVITPADFAVLNDVCARVVQGEVKAQAACTVSYDCEKSLICDKMFCASRVVKSGGQPCASAGEVCAAGSYCSGAGAAQQCAAKKAMGDACNPALPCLETLRCHPTLNTCQPRLALGEACVSSDDCAAAAPFCDPFNGNKCSPGLSFASMAPSCGAYGGTAAPPADAGIDVPPDAGAEAPAGDAGAAG